MLKRREKEDTGESQGDPKISIMGKSVSVA